MQAANANIDAILGETKSPREFEYPDHDFGDLKASTAFNQGQRNPKMIFIATLIW